MPKELEAKLKKEYPNNPHAVYGTMNKIEKREHMAKKMTKASHIFPKEFRKFSFHDEMDRQVKKAKKK